MARRHGRRLSILSCLAVQLCVFAPAFAAVRTDPAEEAPPLCFLYRLPTSLRSYVADDVKLLVGWVFDAAVSGVALRSGVLISAGSGFAEVPGFAAPTSLRALLGIYEVLAPPFDEGHGYYGVALGALDDKRPVKAVILVNRLFRMPVALQDPFGLATDIGTGGAMLIGVRTDAVRDAERAADAAWQEADRRGVPLIIAGQSLAGGFAQLQVAHLQKTRPAGAPVGFLTMNAAYALPLIRQSGFTGRDVAGVNFSKDFDPGVGPHAPFANRVGVQIYVHPDMSASLTPADVSLLSAMLHPTEHFLSSFNAVSLTQALASAIGPVAPPLCR